MGICDATGEMMGVRNRLGIAIETFGSLLDRIPGRPFYRSYATLAQENAADWERELKWRTEHPDDQEFWSPDEEVGNRTKRWFGLIGGYGCCWGICRFGIEMQDWYRKKEWEMYE